MQIVQMPTHASEDEVAAVLAAVACLLGGDAPDEPDQPRRSAWSTAAALIAQRMPAARNGDFAAWHAAERARRANSWSSGII